MISDWVTCLYFPVYYFIPSAKGSETSEPGWGSAVRKETACGGEVGSGREAWDDLT